MQCIFINVNSREYCLLMRDHLATSKCKLYTLCESTREIPLGYKQHLGHRTLSIGMEVFRKCFQ